MIETRDTEILIDGQPVIVMAGEIHYFRLARADWQDRLDRLKSIGGNAVASYIPWIVHEQPDGSFDFRGRTREQCDLVGFINLCRQNDLWFIARIGPFIMAEMKNEGLPYRLYSQHPEIVPTTWDNNPAPTRTVDYLAPAFLSETRAWYAAVLPHLVARLHDAGGPIIAVQLDNEVGMLSWVSQSPDLTDRLLTDFAAWLRATPSAGPPGGYPFALDDAAARAAAIRSPGESYAPALGRDLSRYMRHRYARYIATLRQFAEDEGVRGVPFLVNIHGTDQNRGVTFPIGISQLMDSYRHQDGYIAGSDHYLGDLTTANFGDLYLMNAFMRAVAGPGQPLASLEFEAGDGDYSGDGVSRTDPSAADFKLRMSLAQSNRMINFYLAAGGINYRLDPPSGDGNDRISFTGERHGIAAPVGPEGQLNSTFPRLSRVTRAVMASADSLATMHEEHDGIAFGFNPDDYLTENRYPDSQRTAEIDADLARNRFGGLNQQLARSLLLLGLRFPAVDIRHPLALDPEMVPAVAIGGSLYMDHGTQITLVHYLDRGGRLLINGEIPRFDLAGNPATPLCDALELRPTTDRTSETFYYLSIQPEGWAAGWPEYRVGQLQGFDAGADGCFLRAYGTGEGCGFERPVGAGRATVITTELPGDPAFIGIILDRLGMQPSLRHNSPTNGIFLTSSINDDGARFMYLLNLDGYAKRVHLTEGDRALLDGRELTLGPRDSVMLPLNVPYLPATVRWATTEVQQQTASRLVFRRFQDEDVVALETPREIEPSDQFTVEPTGGGYLLRSRLPLRLDKPDQVMPVTFHPPARS